MGKAINIAGGTLTAKDHAVINHCIKDNSIGIGAGFGNEMAHRLDSVNELTILDGFAMIQGRCYVIYPGDEETLIIRSGSQGIKRHDLVVLEFDNALEKMELKVLEGVESSDPVDPEIIQDNTLGGGNLYQMPMYRVLVDGLNVTIEDLREYMGSAVGKNVDLSVTTFNTPNVSFMVEDGEEENTIRFTNGVTIEGVGGGGFPGIDLNNLIASASYPDGRTEGRGVLYTATQDCWFVKALGNSGGNYGRLYLSQNGKEEIVSDLEQRRAVIPMKAGQTMSVSQYWGAGYYYVYGVLN